MWERRERGRRRKEKGGNKATKQRMSIKKLVAIVLWVTLSTVRCAVLPTLPAKTQCLQASTTAEEQRRGCRERGDGRASVDKTWVQFNKALTGGARKPCAFVVATTRAGLFFFFPLGMGPKEIWGLGEERDCVAF